MTVAPHRASRRAWLVLAAGAGAYFVAVVHRTALGVAGVEALDRFNVGATGLAALSIAQIATYAGLQLPAGRLLDRFGPRIVMVCGAILMGVGQAVLAVSHDYKLALLARVLIGAGDAPIFISACRLVAHWFPPRRAPMMVQITAVTGQAGQLATAIPVAWLLHAHGWQPMFLSLAVLGVVSAGFIAWGVRAPSRSDVADVADPTDAGAGVAAEAAPGATPGATPGVVSGKAVSRAGVRLGFWTHFTALFSANTIALLWGVPFFVTAQGLNRTEASALLTVLTVTKFVVGPIVGGLTARHPLRRSWLVLAFAGVTAVAWIALLVPSTPRPMWQLVVFCIAIAAGGPVSLIGVDYARTFAAEERLGVATGTANMGGFISTIVAVGLVGIVLEVASPGAAYDLDAYRLAFAALIVPWAVGVAGVLRNRAKARADWAEVGVVIPPLREAFGRVRGARRL